MSPIGTLDVRVRGNTLVPPSLLGRFSILCAILRQLHLILHIALLTSELGSLSATAFFVDQLSAGLPLLQLLAPRTPILFYCHFPDLLLVQGRQKWWKRLYRVPFDRWEQWSMSSADAVAVNSNFTKGVVARTWPALAERRELKVVYPAIDTGSPDKERGGKVDDKDEGPMWKDKRVVLSINRFERKKDIGLSIRAYAGLPEEKRKGLRLVIAGMFCPSAIFLSGSILSFINFPLTKQTLQAATTTASWKTSRTTATWWRCPSRCASRAPPRRR